jgi:hypothetical protein
MPTSIDGSGSVAEVTRRAEKVGYATPHSSGSHHDGGTDSTEGDDGRGSSGTGSSIRLFGRSARWRRAEFRRLCSCDSVFTTRVSRVGCVGAQTRSG